MYNLIRGHIVKWGSMALMCSLVACSSGENSNGSAKSDVSHGSVVSAVHHDPLVADTAKVPHVAEVKEEHLVPDAIDEPGVTEVKQDPVVPEVKPDPEVSEVKPDPVMPVVKPNSVVPEVKPEPDVADVKPDPVVTDVKPDPVVPDVKPDPVVPDVKPVTVLPEVKPEPVAPEVKPEPVVPEILEDSEVPEITSQDNEHIGYITPDGIAQCSAEDIKRRVEFDMRDYYIYHDQVPILNISEFDTPESLIEALRVNPDRYSNVQDATTQVRLVEEGINIGHGFWFQPAADGVVRFREIRLGSPADGAGIKRGDEILTINGRSMRKATNNQIHDALSQENSPVEMNIRTGDEAPRAVSVAYEQYRWKTAGHAKRIRSSSNPGAPAVGYLHIQKFLVTTYDEINSALQELTKSGGVDELIVDLRYNPGGRMWVARHIASMVAGEAVAGKVFVKHQWNNKYAENNVDEFFDTVINPLNLPRVLVLTTSETSSASEAFINSLEPYIDVVVIGDVTGGKPFTSLSKTYCNKSINAMLTLRTNAAGVSVSDGIHPDCRVQDGWQVPLNDSRDPLTRAALAFLKTGSCNLATDDTPVVRRKSVQLDSASETNDRVNYGIEQ